MRRLAALVLVVSSLAEASDAGTVFYLARPRAVGRRVPPSLLFDLQGKLKALIKRNNRLLVEGEEDAQLVEGPQINRRALIEQIEAARRSHEELDLEGAQATLKKVIAQVGGLPLTPDAREVWRDAQILTIEIAEAEQDLITRDRTIDELLRVIPRLNPRKQGLTGSLADLVVARKASLKRAVGTSFRVRPADARIFVDGRATASGDRLRPGTHRLLIKAPGHRAQIERIEIDEGESRFKMQAVLRRARLRTAGELDDALASPTARKSVIKKMGDVVRQSGAGIGFLATVGRRTDGRFDLHVAAVERDGSLAGVGVMITGGLLAENDLGHVIGAASRSGVGVPVAVGDWGVQTTLEADAPDPSDFAGLPAARTRRKLPSQRHRPVLKSANFWIMTTLAVVGGGAAYLVYTLQEAPVEEVHLPPTMAVEVNLP